MENDLSPASIPKGLGIGIIGRNILYYPSIPSTMSMAGRIAQEGATEGTVVIAV